MAVTDTKPDFGDFIAMSDMKSDLEDFMVMSDRKLEEILDWLIDRHEIDLNRSDILIMAELLEDAYVIGTSEPCSLEGCLCYTKARLTEILPEIMNQLSDETYMDWQKAITEAYETGLKVTSRGKLAPKHQVSLNALEALDDQIAASHEPA